MGVPIQSSLVHVPCKSGSPHGVLGRIQVFAPDLAAGVATGAFCAAAEAGLFCPTISEAMNRADTPAMVSTNRCFIFHTPGFKPSQRGFRRILFSLCEYRNFTP